LTVTPEPSRELTLAIADSTLAAGLRYGRWVERAPSTEEQVAVSSMSQDKLGQARQFYQLAEDLHEVDAVELQYDREPDAFAWNPAWLAPWTSWGHFVIAQVVFGRALLDELEALAEDVPLREPLAKIEQEDSWHARHGSAWLAQASSDEGAREHFQAALDDLWPHVVTYFGADDQPRFPDDRERGVIETDDELRAALLDEVVVQLEEAGLEVPAERGEEGWRTEPEPSAKQLELTRAAGEETALELAAMLQDPEHRALAEI
jgi:phenylacetate-CoA oxygenase PaaI subunit